MLLFVVVVIVELLVDREEILFYAEYLYTQNSVSSTKKIINIYPPTDKFSVLIGVSSWN